MIVLGAITISYCFLLLFLLYGFYQIPEFFGKNGAPKTAFSIVIPFRNEAQNLPQLLNSLLLLNYPKHLFEIILVNDASEDHSEELCTSFIKNHPELSIQLIENIRISRSPKKDAILAAVDVSTKEFIITTDADCEVPEEWLFEMNGIIFKKDAKLVAGPVALKEEQSKMSFLKLFQEIDFFSLQAATIGGFGVRIPFLSNGANFCYEKAAFLDVEGFSGNDSIASGDDIFLLEKFKKAGFKTAFLKSKRAIVKTSVQPSLSRLVNQRIRWAAKASEYNIFFGKIIGLLVLLMNLSLVLGLAALLLENLPPEIYFFVFLVKFNVDFLLIYAAAEFFGREHILKNYVWCSLVYPFFSSYVGIRSLFGNYSWKGRRFKK